ncbi:hypothetical protein CWI75_14925 [Kineobactrum sediminis]|uniref:Alpha-L-glutamate ligase-related protein ATP-grasp domain-containing protein n=1 Tax=Kineobactrum sediminis TaxID=1905677 RepID=A0A2N5XZE1_9GAMM|nr:sugar-transfer associated ATP-grasp domain-containing protein [Kineobactrum sediminis]PLW81527.1 hypothetical protein CWI75_14925 [Kineobactrum sediminis]
MHVTSIPIAGIKFLSACVRFRANPITALKRFIKLCRDDLFSPDEIYFHRLLDPRIDNAVIRRMISKEKMLEPQLRLNPAGFRHHVDDKITFNGLCVRHGLPTPDIHAIFNRNSASKPNGTPSLRNLEDIERYLRDTSNTPIILKPADGHDGVGVDRLEKRGETWFDMHGGRVTPSLIFSRVQSPDTSRWIFQQVVDNHPEIAELSGALGLQTMRIRTVVNDNGQPELLGALLRLISGDNVYDNFRGGATGNMLAVLDVSDGRIVEVITSSKHHREINSITHHPGTKKQLIGFKIPHWEDVRTLALKASLSFRPLRCIGWDIAITAAGPMLIEGNLTWGILNRERDIYEYLQSMSTDT